MERACECGGDLGKHGEVNIAYNVDSKDVAGLSDGQIF